MLILLVRRLEVRAEAGHLQDACDEPGVADQSGLRPMQRFHASDAIPEHLPTALATICPLKQAMYQTALVLQDHTGDQDIMQHARWASEGLHGLILQGQHRKFRVEWTSASDD